jgi:perosamine synthetase
MTRDELIAALATRGIESRTFFCPMNKQPFLQRMKGFRHVDCPVAERIWETGLYLPSGIQLTETDIMGIVDEIRSAATTAAV